MRVVLFPSKTLVKWGLMTHLRKKRALLMLLAFLGVAFLGTAAFWPEGQITQMAYASRELLMLVSMFFMGGTFVFVPGLAAVTVTVEKERDTFDQLFLTLIRPSGVIVAKLANVLGIYYLLMIGTLPILGAIFFLIGVDWQQVVLMFGLVTATAFSCGMGGILCSIFFRKTIVSMSVSYLLALCIAGAPLLLIVLFYELMGYRSSEFQRLIEYIAQICSPVVATIMILEPQSFGSQTLSVVNPILYQIVLGLFFFLLARRILIRPPKPPKVETRKPIDDHRILEQRRKRFPYYLVDPLRRKKPIEDRRNPMLVKELRWGFLGRADWLIRVFYGALILYLFAGIIVATEIGHVSIGSTIPFIVVQMVLTILATPPLLANSLPKEYEMGNMDFLRSTLLTPHEIVLGKVFAGSINLAPLFCASLCAGIFMLFGTLIGMLKEDFVYLITGYGSLAACVILSLGMSMFASLSTKRTSTSLALGYGLTIMVYLGIPFLTLMLTMWLAPEIAKGRDFEHVVMFLSPISAYVMSADVYRAAHNLSRHTATPLNFYWFSNVVLFSTVGIEFLILSIIRFKYYGMKDK